MSSHEEALTALIAAIDSEIKQLIDKRQVVCNALKSCQSPDTRQAASHIWHLCGVNYSPGCDDHPRGRQSSCTHGAREDIQPYNRVQTHCEHGTYLHNDHCLTCLQQEVRDLQDQLAASIQDEKQWRDVATAFRQILRSRACRIRHEPVSELDPRCISGCRGCMDLAMLDAAIRKYERLTESNEPSPQEAADTEHGAVIQRIIDIIDAGGIHANAEVLLWQAVHELRKDIHSEATESHS